MKTLTIALPDSDSEFYAAVWDELAAELLTADERGQRGAGRSILFRLICTAAIKDFDRTAKLLAEIKQIS